jgi:serine protease Do
MSNRKSTMFFGLLLVVIASIVAGMVLAARLDLSSPSSAQAIAAPPMNSAPITGPVSSTTFRDIAKAATPAVVNIRTESRQRTQDLNDFFGGGGGGGNDLFERFFGQPGPGERDDPPQRPRGRDQLVQAAGTGFIIDKAGLILTNNHVVEGANKIIVSLYGEDDDQEYEARVVGRDPLTDSALIELTEKPNHTLPEVKFGDSAQMQPGDWVMAIGNPFGLAHTVSVGVISALERPFESVTDRNTPVLQTDAAINPGNSGGPLLNVRGEVIGINTAIYSDPRQAGNIGIGFAIPSNTVRELLPQLRGGKVTRGLIGVRVGPVQRDAVDELGLKNRDGALVASVSRGGPAAKAGILPGDVIVAFNGQPVKDNDQLPRLVTATKPGSTVPLKVIRAGQERTLTLTVGEVDLDTEAGTRTARNTRGGEPEPETSSGFGMTVSNVTADVARQLRLDETRGVVIVSVEPGSPAARAGLRPGDVIRQVGRVDVSSAAEAQRELAKVPSRGTALLLVFRNGEDTFVTVNKE